jgi:cellulose synthase/poly-beta-1,6-N-acetylglucosamine synthase-like glycosyltransferase
MIGLLGVVYLLASLGLGSYGLVGLVTLWLYWRHRQDDPPQAAPVAGDVWPPVTVQLPLYNEPLVAERLIDAAVALDYPREKLDIQVMDDSDDGTTAIAAARVARHQAAGVQIELIHRQSRTGYKAGALQEGLRRASGELVAIFDADFIPQPGFLRQTVPHFVGDPELGMVQSRWGHLNADFSSLTRAQAISLDKHFAIEQLVRHRADLFPKFNGSGGIWRAACIRAVGGWLADTLCEDLDLSTRAQLAGWRFLYLPDVVSPAELPPQMTAFKAQQGRWAKGSLQCVVKFGRSILRSRRHSRLGRFYALASMTGYLAHPLLLAMLLLLPPLLYWRYNFSPLLGFLSVAGIAQPLLFVLSQRALYPSWLSHAAPGLPALALIAVGLVVSNTWSLSEIWLRREHPFLRTPKFDLTRNPDGRWAHRAPAGIFRARFSPLPLAELGLALYAGLGASVALWRGAYGAAPFLLLCAAGLGYTALLSLRDTRPSHQA